MLLEKLCACDRQSRTIAQWAMQSNVGYRCIPVLQFLRLLTSHVGRYRQGNNVIGALTSALRLNDR